MNKGIRMVYIAECINHDGTSMGAVKIGCSYGHEDRLKQAYSGLPFTLNLLAAVQGNFVLEKFCHLVFREDRISGEYFRKSEKIMKSVSRAEKDGRFFYYFTDLGVDYVPDGAIQAFMDYHGVTLEEVCKVLRIPLSQNEKRLKNPRTRSRATVAAAAIVAQKDGRFVSWPEDAMRGLNGEKHPYIELYASEDESEAA